MLLHVEIHNHPSVTIGNNPVVVAQADQDDNPLGLSGALGNEPADSATFSLMWRLLQQGLADSATFSSVLWAKRFFLEVLM